MKHVIITGANGGLGTVVVKTFLEKGYTVIATVRSEHSKAELENHPSLHVEILNLNSESEVESFTKRCVDRFKKIDAALMLAGGFAMGDLAATGIAQIRQQFDLNFETAYNLTHPLLKHMLESGSGRLIYIGSRPAIDAGFGKSLVAYALAKSLLFKLADFVNASAKGKNVTATVVVPSTIDTAPNRAAMPDADPANWVQPSELAELMETLTSEKGAAVRELVLKVYGNS